MGDYFGGTVDESAIKESFSLVYQLLEEMMDNGYPLTTEPNALKAMIRPPTTFVRIVKDITGKVCKVLVHLEKDHRQRRYSDLWCCCIHILGPLFCRSRSLSLLLSPSLSRSACLSLPPRSSSSSDSFFSHPCSARPPSRLVLPAVVAPPFIAR